MSTNEKTHWRVVTLATWPAPPAEMSDVDIRGDRRVPTALGAQLCRVSGALGRARLPACSSPLRWRAASSTGARDHHEAAYASGRAFAERPERPQVLRELGGYTRVVEECVERILKRYIDNLRAGALMEHAQRALRGQVPTLRVRVQSMLSRLRLPNSAPPAPAASAPKSGGPPPRLPAQNGSTRGGGPREEHRVEGKIDLLVLGDDARQITDFKTGATDEAHKFQVRAYAVMWRLDDELNPSGRVVDRLVLAYENQDVDVAPPITSEIDEIGQNSSRADRQRRPRCRTPALGTPEHRVVSLLRCAPTLRRILGQRHAGGLG